MAKKINKPLNHVAKLGRTSFDMSKEIKFTSSCGDLLPIYYDYLSPGEKINIGTSIFSRTKPLATPAFTSIHEYVDYFFVPFRQLSQAIENKITNIPDFKSDLYDGIYEADNYLPRTGLETLFDAAKTKDEEFFNALNPDFIGSISYQPYLYDIARVMDLLGFNPTNIIKHYYPQQGEVAPPIYVNNNNAVSEISLLPLLAYHKIFNDHYRNSDYTRELVRQFNLDTLGFEPAPLSVNNVMDRELYKIHRRPYRKDFFTNIFPKPLGVASFNSLGLSPILYDTNELANHGNLIEASGYFFPSNNGQRTATPITETVSIKNNNVNAIRASFAYDKLLRITQGAPKTIDAQIAAHFGWKIPKGVDGRVYYLGTDESRIDVGEIASTSDTLSSDGTSGAQLGTLAGKGAGFKEGKAKFEFTAPCHGVLMAIYSAVPIADYEASIDKLLNYITVDNLYIPEFDDLGLQALYTSQLALASNGSPIDGRYNNFIGFQFRWSELKQKYNSIHADFLDTLPDWVVNRNRRISDISDYNLNTWLYCIPNALDSITEVAYIPTFTADWRNELKTTTIFSRDPLMHWFSIHCFKTSTMSMYSLPKL